MDEQERNAAMRHYVAWVLGRAGLSKKASLTERRIARIRAVRHDIRVSEGGGGMCHEVTAWLSEAMPTVRLAVSYLAPSGEVACSGHYVSLLADGSILDPTADQFGEGHDVRLLGPRDPEYGRYRPEFDNDFNPALGDEEFGPVLAAWSPSWHGEGDYEQEKRLEEERGAGWWLDDPSSYVAYWEEQLEIADARYRPFCEAVLASVVRNAPAARRR
jgi:hypothetical protein